MSVLLYLLSLSKKEERADRKRLIWIECAGLDDIDGFSQQKWPHITNR